MQTGRPPLSPASEFGTRLRELREEAKISQKEVAIVLGISQPSYAKWERREVAVSPSQLRLLAETFGCEVGNFFTDDEVKKPRGPVGRAKKMFEEVSQLPRYRQRDILEIVERLLAIHQRAEDEKEYAVAEQEKEKRNS